MEEQRFHRNSPRLGNEARVDWFIFSGRFQSEMMMNIMIVCTQSASFHFKHQDQKDAPQLESKPPLPWKTRWQQIKSNALTLHQNCDSQAASALSAL